MTNPSNIAETIAWLEFRAEAAKTHTEANAYKETINHLRRLRDALVSADNELTTGYFNNHSLSGYNREYVNCAHKTIRAALEGKSE